MPKTTKAYVVWGKDSPEDGYVYVFVESREAAISQACELFGYDAEYLAGLEMTAENAVCAIRAPTLDEYRDRGSVPEQVFLAVVGQIKLASATGAVGGAA